MDARVLTEVLIGNKIVNLDSRVTALTTSAKVQLFPDPNTGIRITDGTNDVFKCITGGTDVGDVILGSATGQYVKWDKSAGKLIVNGELAANTLTGTELKATANLTVGSSNDVIRLSGDDSTYRIWVGHETAASAPFRVTKAGVLTAVGATIETAASGARVRIFPDPNTGIQVIDDGGADVLKALVGGTDVGDVIIGNTAGLYLQYDKSAGELKTNMIYYTAIGGGLSDAEAIKIGRVGTTSHAEVQVISGDSGVCGKLCGNGTGPNGQGSGLLWLKNASRGTSSTKEAILSVNPWDISLTYDGRTVLSLTNTSTVAGLADFAQLKIDAGKGIDITGEVGGIGLSGYLHVNGVKVLDAQQSAIADLSETGTAEDSVCRAKVNDILAALRAHGLIAT